MEMIESLRKIMAAAVAARLGVPHNQNRQTVTQKKVIGKESDVIALPVDDSQWLPLQDLDPDSPTFSQFFYMAGYDIPGDPAHPFRP